MLGSALLLETGATQPTSAVHNSGPVPIVDVPASFLGFDDRIFPPRFKQDPRLGERLANRPDFIWPVENGWITDLYDGEHAGVDIGFEHSPPLFAARDGVVAFAGGEVCCGKGLHVILWHDDGWSTLYGHLDSFSVQVGDKVKQGEEIGIGGNTGNSTGPHVHLELYQSGLTVDPMAYFPPDIEIRLEPDATATPTVTETPGEEEPESTPTPRRPRGPEPTTDALPSATLPPPTPPKPTPVPTVAASPPP
jgi:murein DD-endopeptidase MepM/ murein hydrolase activator NlpD